MVPPKPFQILRLPFVPLQEVLRAMDPFELINFSMISKRAKAVTKQITFYSTYSIQLSIDDQFELWVVVPRYMTSCFYKFTSNVEMNGKVKKIDWNDRNELFTWKYSDKPGEEWKQLCKHVLEIFKKRTIDVLLMTMDSVVDQNVWIIDFLKSNAKSVSECDLFQSKQNNDVEEDAAYFLNNITINSKLFFKLNIKNENFHGKIPKNLEELNIRNSQWIGYDKLLKIDCKSVILNRNRISDDQWNLFIKKWIAMETHSNLELLELDYRELDNFRDCVLHDIPLEEIDGGIKRVLKTCRDKNIEINGGIDIRRIDGKTATFFAKRTFWKQYLAMSIH